MTTRSPFELNCGIPRYASLAGSAFEPDDEGHYCEWDDVWPVLMKYDGLAQEKERRIRELENDYARVFEALEATQRNESQAIARVRELEVERDVWAERAESEGRAKLEERQKLAAANALIGECLEHGLKIGAPRLRLRMRAHLAAQPAAPLSDDLGTALRQVIAAEQPTAPSLRPLNLVEDRSPEQLAADGDAAPSRTEAG